MKISHRNVIANTMQVAEYEKPLRAQKSRPGQPYTDVTLGLLPQSHIYALVVLCHAGPYRGDQVVILPKFEMGQFLGTIQKYRINTLYVVCVLEIFRMLELALILKSRCRQSSLECCGTRMSAASST